MFKCIYQRFPLLIEHLSIFCQLDWAGFTIKQGKTQFLFQYGNSPTEGGLLYMHGLSGTRETVCICYSNKKLNLEQTEVQ